MPALPPGTATSRKRIPGLTLVASAVLVVTAFEARSREAEDFLTQRWYQLEVIVFERGPADATVRRMTAPERYPQTIMPFTNASPGDDAVAFAPEPVVRDADAALFSDRPPPLWLAGECVATHWLPPAGWSDAEGVLPHDPCLPPPPTPVAETGAAAGQGPDPAAGDTAPAVATPIPGPSSRELARQALTEAFAQYERRLSESSYIWHPNPPAMRTEINRLGRRFDILAAGSWHQALPPRDQPQPLLFQAGQGDGRKPFDVEGWLAVTVQRFVHFEVRLWVRLDDAAFALVSESRRLRSGEVHYLDHPVLGVIVRVGPVDVPGVLRDQAERLDAFGQ
ncbi:MAG: CsiV family protein [Gammaproteobacteria bacterium]|nr:CsiV family protein [Gammaproteobacteria bacterium]